MDILKTPLYTDEISTFLWKYIPKDVFLGCFPANKIPWKQLKKHSQPWIIIANFDNSSQEGSHYTALASRNNKLYYYDSLGLSNYTLNFVINTFRNEIWSNLNFGSSHQDNMSQTCGFFVIWFSLEFYFKQPNFLKMSKLAWPMTSEKNKENNNFYVMNQISKIINHK